jgi:hypothetical protein
MGRGPPRGLARLGPAYAASSPAMSSFTIFKIAWATRRALLSQATTSEMAWLNGSSGPALIAWNGCPKRVKSTIFTDPAGPLGESTGSGVTRFTRESGKIEA